MRLSFTSQHIKITNELPSLSPILTSTGHVEQVVYEHDPREITVHSFKSAHVPVNLVNISSLIHPPRILHSSQSAAVKLSAGATHASFYRLNRPLREDGCCPFSGREFVSIRTEIQSVDTSPSPLSEQVQR